ncbi:DUF3265 domain-containing protein [Vibrio metschnikovii]|nr:DUF3265 domain-containing protein [Vibrio metschnikovii]
MKISSNPKQFIVSLQWILTTISHFSANKRFKRDFQRVAFLLCVDFGGFSVMRKVGSSVVSPLSGRYATSRNLQ